MQIVTDRWVGLSTEVVDKLDIRYIPTVLSLGGTVHSDESSSDRLTVNDVITRADGLPTSQLPSASELAAFYTELGARDSEILSVHVSSGIMPVVELAREAARIVREANVTVIDTRAISLTQGWQVESAAWAAGRDWPIGRIQSLLDRIRKTTEVVFLLPAQKYRGRRGGAALVRGAVSSLLGLRPLVGVAGTDGRFTDRADVGSSAKAVARIVDCVGRLHQAGSEIRAQLGHAGESEELEMVRDRLSAVYTCHWDADCALSDPVATQIGPGAVAVAFAPWESFSSLESLQTRS